MAKDENTVVGLRSFQVVRPLTDGLMAEQVVSQVREMIRQGSLKPGDRLPPERELAKRLGISRASLRHGLQSLAAIGVLTSRHGSGTYIAEGPPALDSEPLQMLAHLHRFTPDEMFEARKLLEVGVAGLAAQNAQPEDLATMAEEISEMFATLDHPRQYLVHDIRFHRAVGAASGNPILAALVNMVSTAMYERRRATVERATDLKESVEFHRRIYRFIRAGKAEEARAAMSEHLELAQQAFASEETSRHPRPAPATRASSSKARRKS